VGDDRFVCQSTLRVRFSRLSRWRHAQNDMFCIQKNQTCAEISQFFLILI